MKLRSNVMYTLVDIKKEYECTNYIQDNKQGFDVFMKEYYTQVYDDHGNFLGYERNVEKNYCC